MPFCPQCRHEYESHAVDCPDCDVALVEVLGAEPEKPEFSLMLLLAAGEQAAKLAEGSLRRVGLPVRRLDPDKLQSQASEIGLLVPQEMFRQAVSLLDADARLFRTSAVVHLADEQGEVKEQALICYQLFELAAAETGEIRAPDLLQRPLEELVAESTEIVGELLEFIRRGDETTRKQALAVVHRMGPNGLEALTRMLAVLCREGREAALFAVLKLIESRLTDSAQLADLVAVAVDQEQEPRHRALALHALGRCGLRGVYEPILTLLDDPDPIIREEADETLCTLSDEDMGFDPELPEPERARIRENWRVWFLDNRGA
jgi:hypothetical protein